MTERLKRSFDDLIAEAEAHPTSGWDFSWLDERMKTTPPPWDFTDLVVEKAREAKSMLDMGTGGGEWLDALPVKPPRTFATEGWKPNVLVARKRLAPLGIEVVQVDGAPDNVLQNEQEHRGHLPFADGSFDLVVNRNESFVASEVVRVLAPGGRFLTQQLGDGLYREFCETLGIAPPNSQPWLVSRAIEQVEKVGLMVIKSAVGQETVAFADVGALAWYLRMVSWAVPGFFVSSFRGRLAQLHEQIQADGPVVLPLPGFYLEAVTGTTANKSRNPSERL